LTELETLVNNVAQTNANTPTDEDEPTEASKISPTPTDEDEGICIYVNNGEYWAVLKEPSEKDSQTFSGRYWGKKGWQRRKQFCKKYIACNLPSNYGDKGTVIEAVNGVGLTMEAKVIDVYPGLADKYGFCNTEHDLEWIKRKFGKETVTLMQIVVWYSRRGKSQASKAYTKSTEVIDDSAIELTDSEKMDNEGRLLSECEFNLELFSLGCALTTS
jgi:hypothetical protein